MKCKECGEEMEWTKTNREIDGPHAYLTYECKNGHTKTEITLKEHLDAAFGYSDSDEPDYYYDPFDEPAGYDDW